MPEKITGRNDVIGQIDEKFETDRFGVDTIQLNVEVPDDLFPALVLPSFAAHPRFPGMGLARRSGSRIKPGWWRVTYTFEGFLFEMPEPTYELSGALDQEPIEAHPDFVAEIGGKPSAPLNGAVFIAPETGMPTTDDSVGVFREFAATIGGQPNIKGGLASYLAPGAEWKVTEFSRTRPATLPNLGRIDVPQGPNPNLPGRNWLMFNQTYSRRGGIYQITSTWKLSGRNGWDANVY